MLCAHNLQEGRLCSTCGARHGETMCTRIVALGAFEMDRMEGQFESASSDFEVFSFGHDDLAVSRGSVER